MRPRSETLRPWARAPPPPFGLVRPGRTGTSCSPPGRWHLAGRINVRGDGLGELVCVLLVQVDLIVDPVEPEPDGAIGFAAVNVVYIQDLCPLSHCFHSASGLDLAPMQSA